MLGHFDRRMGMNRMLLMLLPTISVGAPLPAADPPPVRELIEQLGSADFARRERAARLLTERDTSVLPALRDALSHRDLEVRRRVRQLIPALEAAAALTPKRVTLGPDPMTRTVALRELKRQTGIDLALTEPDDGNRYPLAMKDVPYWEAVERIRRAAGLASPYVSVDGAFRVELRRVHEGRELALQEQEHRNNVLILALEVLPEPRFLSDFEVVGP